MALVTLVQEPGQVPPVPSVCPYCAVGCSLLLHCADGRLDDVTARRDDDQAAAPICIKARLGLDFIHHADRLTAPLIRRGWQRGPDGRWAWAGARPAAADAADAQTNPGDAYGTPGPWLEPFREATWDEALELTAQQLATARAITGPRGVAALASAKCSNEENYALMRLMRGALGSNSIDHCARLCHAASVAAMQAQLGAGLATGAFEDIDHADVLLVAGANLTEAHPVLGTRVLKAMKRGARLIVVDTRRTEMAARATHFLCPRPGTDAVLYGAMMQHLISTQRYDRDFVAHRLQGFGAAAMAVGAVTLDEGERVTGIPAGNIREAAELFAAGPATTTLWAMGLTQHARGTDTVHALLNLALVCGMVGRPGAALMPIRGQNNVQGACDMGALPNAFTDYQRVEDPAVRAKFATAWGVPVDRLDAEPGLWMTQMTAADSAVRALYVLGENPALSDPDTAHLERWVSQLDFMVVQDLFLTETARLADVVLPAASFAEKEGTYVNAERRIQLGEVAVEPPGSARPELGVLIDLTERLGLPVGPRTAADTLAEIAGVSPSWSGVSYESLREHGSLQHPVSAAHPDGTIRLHTERFPTSSGRALLTAVPMVVAPDEQSADWPFVVMTGRRRFHWHTGTLTRRSEALAERDPSPTADLHPDDALALGVADGDRIRIVTAQGQIELPAQVNARQQRGQVFVPMHFREAGANRLTSTAIDPVSGTPSFKFTPARVERVGGAPPDQAGTDVPSR